MIENKNKRMTLTKMGMKYPCNEEKESNNENKKWMGRRI